MYFHLHFYILALFTLTLKFCGCSENVDEIHGAGYNETVKQAGTITCPCGVQYLQRGSGRNLTLGAGSRIKGGRDARLGEYPWVVRMRAGSSSVDEKGNTLDITCTGALIARQWVLLAAHCFCFAGATPGPSFFRMNDIKLYIYYGETTRNDANTRNRLEFKLRNPQMVFFPRTKDDLPGDASRYDFEKCEPAGDGGDIALVRLPRPIQMGRKFRQGIVCMPYDIKSNLDDYQNQRFTAFLPGWGVVFSPSGTNMNSAQTLKTVELQLTPGNQQNCQRPAGALCAFSRRRDACGGDSGSSLLIRKGSKFYSIGVVSHGPNCDVDATSPGVYTFVDNYIQWIQRTLKVNTVPLSVPCN